jgi:multiple antibiotic resistance protein
VPTTFDNRFVYEFVTLFVILDPVATVPIFLFVTAGLSRRNSLVVAAYALSVAFLVLLFFISGGQFLLDALKIPRPAFQLAGSLILLLFGVNMVLCWVMRRPPGATHWDTLVPRATLPRAGPRRAGAGAILTVVLLTDNRARSFAEQASTTGVLVLCLVCFFALFAISGLIFRLLGRSGIEIVTRVFGLILASIAVNGLIVAIKLSFMVP